jgi:hypothetical protein
MSYRYVLICGLILLSMGALALSLREVSVSPAPVPVSREPSSAHGELLSLEPLGEGRTPNAAVVPSEEGVARALQEPLALARSTVIVNVYDNSDPTKPRPLGGVGVFVQDLSAAPRVVSWADAPTASRSVTDTSGVAVLAAPSPGAFTLQVDIKTVPSHLWQPESFKTLGQFDGLSLESIKVNQPGQVIERDIFLLPQRELLGQIDMDLDDACSVVALSTLPGQEGVSFRAPIDGSGRFHFDQLPPLEYLLRIDCGATDVLIPPKFVDTRDSSLYGVRIAAGSGPGRVDGVVVDAAGAAVAGIDVLIYYCKAKGFDFWGAPDDYRFTWNNAAGRAVSDASGRFLVEGIHVGPVRVMVGVKASSNSPPHGQAILRSPPHVDLFISEGSGALHSLPPFAVQLAE